MVVSLAPMLVSYGVALRCELGLTCRLVGMLPRKGSLVSTAMIQARSAELACLICSCIVEGSRPSRLRLRCELRQRRLDYASGMLVGSTLQPGSDGRRARGRGSRSVNVLCSGWQAGARRSTANQRQ